MKRPQLKQLMLGSAFCLAGATAQAVTPFQTDVSTSIDMGLAYLNSAGAFNNPSSAGDAVGLTTLALLEKRTNNDPNLPALGYSGATPADQTKLRTVVRYIINSINSQGNGFYAYRDGAYMMALSLYMRTGGPDKDDGPTTELDGAPLTLKQAYDKVVDRTLVNQRQGFGDSGAPWPENNGYWCYTNNGCRDSSTTQLVVAGLASALSVYNTPAFADAARVTAIQTAAARARTAYQRNGIPGYTSDPNATIAGCGANPGEKGHGYNAGSGNTLQQTASGTWIQLVGGANLNDPDVQAYLRWLQHRYSHLGNNGGTEGWPSHWYYMWSFSKALEFLTTSGVTPNPGNIGPADIGTLPAASAPVCNRAVHRDTATDPRVALFGAGGAGFYAAETPRVYYDFAYNLLSWQCANGSYNCNSSNPTVGGLPGYWDNYSHNAYALLVLQRSVGGGFIDTDKDQIPDTEDNCPAVSNPNQADADRDGVGDACDNCPNTPNPDQTDANGNGKGDVCEFKYCDVDNNGSIDNADILLIKQALGKPTNASDPRNPDKNNVINLIDVKICIGRIGK